MRLGSLAPSGRSLARGLARLLAVGVWGAAVAASIFLWRGQEQGFLVPAVATSAERPIAASVPGRIETLAVVAYAEVAKGQIVAVLDDAELRVDLARARAELARLSAEVEREGARLARQAAERAGDEAADLRRFVRDEERARIAELDLAAELATDRIRLRGLELLLTRSRGLAGERVGRVARFEDDKIAFDALARSLDERAAELEARHARVESAVRMLAAYRARTGSAAASDDALLRPFRATVRVQELRIAGVELRLAEYVLRAPIAGRVGEILHAQGAFVGAGDELCTIHEVPAREALAYAPDVALSRCRVGARVVLRRRGAPSEVYEARITSLGPAQVEIPARFSLDPRRPSFALPLRIRLPEGLAAVPGEAFEVFLRALE